jgi:Flp pilus assembly protein TadG
MNRRGGAMLHNERGSAAIEVALAFPLLLMVLGNLADYGLMMRRHAQLATGVANAAQYASMSGASASAELLQGIANASSWLPGASASAGAAACYCPSGTPPALGSAVACTTTCGSGQLAQKYVTITASYIYTPMMPGPTGLTATTLTSTAKVMVR